MAPSELLKLSWKDQPSFSLAFKDMRNEEDLFDITLSVGSQQIKAHKLVMSVSSPFFKNLIHQNPHPHPLIYLKGVDFSTLQSILDFIYYGEITVEQKVLSTFLSVADELKIKGLTSQPQNPPPPPSTSKPPHPPAKCKTSIGWAKRKPRLVPVPTVTPSPPPLPAYSSPPQENLSQDLPSDTQEEVLSQNLLSLSDDHDFVPDTTDSWCV